MSTKTAHDEFDAIKERDQLQSKLTAYEKQWTEMDGTICKFQEENTKLKKQLQDAQLPTTEHIQAIYEVTQLKDTLEQSEKRVNYLLQWMQEHSVCSECGYNPASSAPSPFQDLKYKLEQSERYGAQMREALHYCHQHNHADTNNGRIACLGHECRVCDRIRNALSSDYGKSMVPIEQVRVLESALLFAKTRQHDGFDESGSHYNQTCEVCQKIEQALDLCKKLEGK